ncbi:MAG: signal peptidase I [Candidatus Staskawiczbacteria bacterium]|nr:signal peptidase I [Candidatus Staskawiczbacteria bacterium]
MEENNEAKIKPQESKKGGVVKKFLPFVWEIVQMVVIALAIVLPIRYFLFQPFIVRGESMVPSFMPGDYLIVDELSYRFSNPERGNVIVFKYPKDTTQRFIKRIIGLPNETIEIKDGKVTIYNSGAVALLEEYLPDDLKTEGETKVVLGDDEYFVLGDNRSRSFDSRMWGTVPKGNIIGKAYLRIFPLNTLSQIPTPSY